MINKRDNTLSNECSATRTSRRKYLLNGAKLGIAGSLGLLKPALAQSLETGFAQQLDGVSPLDSAGNQIPITSDTVTWEFEQFMATPEQTQWQILDAHDTGHMTIDWEEPGHSVYHRVNFEPPQDGRRAFCHQVVKGEIVHPVGFDSDPIAADFSSFSKVLMRYHHWIETPSYVPGKWIGLQLGRGWISRGYAKDELDIFGTDGGSSTTMHPGRETGNGIRLLSSHTSQPDAFGDRIGRGMEVLPTGRWLTVDVIIDRHSGHRLYVDGALYAISDTVTPIANWEACRAIWYRNRLMHGGWPQLFPAVQDYREWFGGFFIGVA